MSQDARDGYRIERDTMGEMRVPAGSYYGAQTARAHENFPIARLRFPRDFIRALGMIKREAAAVNQELGLLPNAIAEAIASSASSRPARERPRT